MIIIFIRAIIIFATLFIVMRFMGKRQIGEMQPFEFIITLIIADLACIPMSDMSIPLLYGLTAIVAIFLLHQIICMLEQTSQTAKFILSGKPSIVIDKNGVNFSELKKNNLDMVDLIESMRNAGYFDLDQIDYGIFEANGQFSAKAKLDYEQNCTSMPIILISNGQVNRTNLKIAKLSNDFIDRLRQAHNLKSIKNIGILTVNGDGKGYMQLINHCYKIIKIDLPKEAKW